MSIYEYDEEKHMQQEREEWEEIGWKEGEAAGRKAGEKRMKQLIQCLLSAGRTEELERIVSDEELKEKLCREFGI